MDYNTLNFTKQWALEIQRDDGTWFKSGPLPVEGDQFMNDQWTTEEIVRRRAEFVAARPTATDRVVSYTHRIVYRLVSADVIED